MPTNKQSRRSHMRGPVPIKRDKTLVNLHQKGRATSSDLKVATPYMTLLAEKGYVKVIGRKPTGKVGRYKNVYALTPRGRGRALTVERRKTTAKVAA